MTSAIETATQHLTALRNAAILGDCHVRQLLVLATALVDGKGDERTARDFTWRFRDWTSYGRGPRG